MFIKDPADLMIFPEYIQKYLNGEYVSEEHPEEVGKELMGIYS